MDQLEAVILALLAGPRQHLAVGRPEDVVDGKARQRRGAADGQQAECLGQGRERRFCGAAATEAGDGGRERLQGIADEGGEHALAPALGDLLQAPEPARELVLAFLRLHPGQHAEAQPHHGLRAGVVLREAAHGVAHRTAVGMGEGHERGGGARHGGAEAAQAAALDQDREAAGERGLGETFHELGEGPRRAGTEGHVEGAVEAAADTDAGAHAHGVADEDLRRERRREGAGLGRLGRAGRCGPGRSPVVYRGHGAPVRRGGVGPVDEHPHGPERLLVAEPLRHHARLTEERRQGVHERPVPRLQSVEHGMGTLGLARLRQPVLQSLPEPFAAPPGLRYRQARGPGPAGEHHGLGGEQGAEPTRPLVENVCEGETQPRRLVPGPHTDPLYLRPGLVRRAFQHQVQGVAGFGEAAVEAPARELDEALQLFRPGHGARPVDSEERHQRAVRAGQKPVADGRLRQEKTLQRLAPEGPACGQRVLENPAHRVAPRASDG